MSKPKVTLAPFMTAKRKAAPVEEPEEIEDDEDQDDTASTEWDEGKEPRYHDDPPEEAIGEQEEDPTKEVPKKCVREGCKYPRTPSPRKPENKGLCKYHSDQVRLKARKAEEPKPKKRKQAAPEGTPADKLGRLLAVVERLGGLEAAERLAEVLNGLR